MYMVAVTTVCCYTQENMFDQATCSMLITVEPELVVDTLLCPKCIVFVIVSRENGWS